MLSQNWGTSHTHTHIYYGENEQTGSPIYIKTTTSIISYIYENRSEDMDRRTSDGSPAFQLHPKTKSKQ